MIEIHRVSKSYGRRTALADVSLQILPGEVTLLLGANGAGKSTLLRCLLGIIEFEGSIRVADVNPLVNGCLVRALVGYMPQSGGLHQELTVEETIDLYADIRRASRDRCAALLQEAGLADHKTARVGDLSGGLRQRLGFALALLTDPKILVLDEPTASLDRASREWLAGRLRAVAAEGRTVLVSTHAGQELLDVGDRRIVLEAGRVVSDTRTSPSQGARPPGALAPGTAVGSVRPLIIKEIRDAVSNRWLLSYSIVLGLLGFAAAQTGLESSSGLALQAFGRTTATLMNLCLLLAPLVAVLMGGSSIAGERERGTLEHLLAQPLSRTGLLLAKHAGLLLSLTAATAIGFVPAGALVAWHTGFGMLGQYLLFPLIAVLAGAAMVAIGMLVSVSSRTAVQSQGAAVFVWFAFVLLYDLVLMGSLAVTGMPVWILSFSLVANPVDAARVLGVLSLEPDLYLLGPAGAYLTARFSRGGAAAVLIVALFVWATVPLAVATFRFRLRRPTTTRSARTRTMASVDEVTVS
jgi:ABC-type multidrug transport system ATPase subunit/ABC-type transport system involved in multi-copper enzyme maturation permease subunit